MTVVLRRWIEVHPSGQPGSVTPLRLINPATAGIILMRLRRAAFVPASLGKAGLPSCMFGFVTLKRRVMEIKNAMGTTFTAAIAGLRRDRRQRLLFGDNFYFSCVHTATHCINLEMMRGRFSINQ